MNTFTAILILLGVWEENPTIHDEMTFEEFVEEVNFELTEDCA